MHLIPRINCTMYQYCVGVYKNREFMRAIELTFGVKAISSINEHFCSIGNCFNKERT
jgi:hypothetical protein